MIFFKYKQLYSTYSFQDYEMVKKILNKSNISYSYKVKNLVSPNLFEINRGRKDTLGIKNDSSKEYSIYVKKDIYSKAKHLIEKI